MEGCRGAIIKSYDQANIAKKQPQQKPLVNSYKHWASLRPSKVTSNNKITYNELINFLQGQQGKKINAIPESAYDFISDSTTDITKDSLYKINLMPVAQSLEEYYGLVKKISEQLSNEKELIDSFAFLKDPFKKSIDSRNNLLPLITINPRVKIGNAQQLLNNLYDRLKNIPGLKKAPAFNAQVNDLIYISQGDTFTRYHYKTKDLYKGPDFIYLDATKDPRKRFTQEEMYLLHPKNAEKLVFSGERFTHWIGIPKRESIEYLD